MRSLAKTAKAFSISCRLRASDRYDGKTDFSGSICATLGAEDVAVLLNCKPNAGNVPKFAPSASFSCWERGDGRAGQPSDVATGMREARDEAIADGMSNWQEQVGQ